MYINQRKVNKHFKCNAHDDKGFVESDLKLFLDLKFSVF